MLKNYPIARLVAYIIGVVALILSFFATEFHWPGAQALVQTANVLGAIAGVGAISNLGSLSPRASGVPVADDQFISGFDDPIPADEILDAPAGNYAAPKHAKRD